MLSFLTNLLPSVFSTLGGIASSAAEGLTARPKVSAWSSIGVGVAGLLGFAPGTIKSFLLSVAATFTNIANLIG